ncbi:MAG: amino acid racemase [Candidatus Micrarchaeia archaeon]
MGYYAMHNPSPSHKPRSAMHGNVYKPFPHMDLYNGSGDGPIPSTPGIIGLTNSQQIAVVFNPQTPDQTLAIQGKAPSPVPYLLDSIRLLNRLGADFVIVPCNTAHYFMPEVMARAEHEGLKTEFISMIDEAARATRDAGAKKVGILATTGTISTGLYQRALEEYGITALVPSPDSQEKLVMESIYGEGGIKAGFTHGKPRELMQRAASELVEKGAEALLLACTEIPLVITEKEISFAGKTAMIIDASQVLAEAALRRRGRIGIAGGLGPAATVDLLKKLNAESATTRLLEEIVSATTNYIIWQKGESHKVVDQEHLRVYALYTNNIEDGVKAMELIRADFLVFSPSIPLGDIRKVGNSTKLPILNLYPEIRALYSQISVNGRAQALGKGSVRVAMGHNKLAV